ncbi:UDP-3-O-(3-hydroxymyristoyl)glucosamine N-acyltransferase [Candidatus Dependentiae bacterium]|nr:UDP-3-O-(3-hydroxymyristoyl)glucosamine N-acyltransferase [Candidatus Dependentiae bacterium]
MKSFKLSKITKILSGELKGDPDIEVDGLSDIREAEPGSISFITNPKYEKYLESSNATAFILKNGASEVSGKNLIFVDEPYKAVGILLALFNERKVSFSGVSENAYISEGVKLGKDIRIAPLVYIGLNVEIGPGSVIYPGVHIGDNSIVGGDCIIYQNVSIYDFIEIGDRVIIHSGTVIGSDGFGFATVEGINSKIPQIGKVIIEDDVEIGANVTIDRATFGSTKIKKGVKIDNLVQIAHNVEVGENSLLVAQVGIAGSSKLGQNVILAAKAGVSGHIEIGNNVKVGAKSGVMKSIPEGLTVSGFPARKLSEELRVKATLRGLPKILDRVKQLEERVSNIENKEE